LGLCIKLGYPLVAAAQVQGASAGGV
jgi:hypothetical protein